MKPFSCFLWIRLVLPEMMGSIAEHDVAAVLTVTVLDHLVRHSTVLLLLFLVPGLCLGDHAGEFSYRGGQLLLDGFLQGFVASVVDSPTTPYDGEHERGNVLPYR